ncbi:MAG: spermidine/putrescine ABC transporter substrate-binding protein [Clostridia bacterium]|nr:spermidine/putrescine ABC transporter substrate-binding protein [Clostridia bacterium]
MKRRTRRIIIIAVVAALAIAAILYFAVFKNRQDKLIVYNWYDYIDESVIEQFEEETGIKVNYVNFTTVEEMYTQMTAGNNSYDIVVPSDYIVERLIKEDKLAALDYEKLPNAKANILDTMWAYSYDNGNKYSVPYMWGTMGILYNTEKVNGEITSWSSLFDPQYKNGVFMLDSIRDMMGVMLKYQGYSLNDFSDEALSKVSDLLIEQKNNGIVAGYMVDEVKDKMIAGEGAMAVMWSGDAMYAIMENDKLAYVVPEEGSNVWVDAMCVPKDSKHYDWALKFIDFMCRPDIAKKNYEYIYYASPIKQVVAELPAEEAENVAVNPNEEILAKCETFTDMMDKMEQLNKYWMKIRN